MNKARAHNKHSHRLDRLQDIHLQFGGDRPRGASQDQARRNCWVNISTGRLIFAHTFDNPQEVVDCLMQEKEDERDIAFYVPDPHVVIAKAPQALFLDPSHTFRLWMHDYRPAADKPRGFTIRPIRHKKDLQAIARIYASQHMMAPDPKVLWEQRQSREICYALASTIEEDQVIGMITGVDHFLAIDDPRKGSSLWNLAVDPQTIFSGVGQALVRHIIERFQARGLNSIDLSVIHDNRPAISLYKKLGFRRVPVMTLKRRNTINEKLFSGPDLEEEYNPYARIIINEARRRGIMVEAVDAPHNYFRLSFGGRSIVCHESLSEMTSAIAMSRCADKEVTRKVLQKAGLRVPAQMLITARDKHTKKKIAKFLNTYHAVVIKPANGEQGQGVNVNLNSEQDILKAIREARNYSSTVLMEEFVAGEDLRVVVIGGEVVAAAIRRPPEITGDGQSTIRQLIQKLSRRRSQATDGESKIPIDTETKRCIKAAGANLDQVLESGRKIILRRTANLHTGGTIHDVTSDLHSDLAEAAVKAAQSLDIPVVGIDMQVKSCKQGDYTIIEANERPGLANHEPNPTASKFIDLLFPSTVQR